MGDIRDRYKQAVEEGVGVVPGAHPEFDPDYRKNYVGGPGSRPLATAENLPAIEAEIKKVHANVLRRREGALRNPRR